MLLNSSCERIRAFLTRALPDPDGFRRPHARHSIQRGTHILIIRPSIGKGLTNSSLNREKAFSVRLCWVHSLDSRLSYRHTSGHAVSSYIASGQKSWRFAPRAPHSGRRAAPGCPSIEGFAACPRASGAVSGDLTHSARELPGQRRQHQTAVDVACRNFNGHNFF